MYKGKIIEKHYRRHNFLSNSFKSLFIHRRDEEYPMFAGRRIRFIQLRRASEIYYYKRSHTDWEG